VNWLGSLAHDAKEDAGTVLNDGSHVLGDGLSAVGLNGAAQAVDTEGDKLGYDLGASVPELELGQTSDPAELVHGDPGAIRSSASTLRRFSSAFGETAAGLNGLDPSSWTGSAADAFRAKYAPHPAQWRTASSATGSASGALESYAGAVADAQSRAGRAIDLYAQGQQATATATAAYNAQVAAYDSAAQAYNARLAAGTDPGTPPAEPGPFTDPGAALREQAEQVLSAARSARDAEASAAAATISQATGQAPAEPSLWAQVGDDLSDGAQVMALGQVHELGGVLEGAADIVKLGRSLDPFDQWNVTHPAEYLAGLSGTGAGLAGDVLDPANLVKSVVGTGWGSDPFDALGRLVPNVALTVVTDGGGAAADAGIDAATSAGEDAGEQAAARAGLGEAADPPGPAAQGEPDISTEGDPVDVTNGDVVMFAEDIALPGVLPLAVGRAYRSSWRLGRWFGPGWASTLDQRVSISGDRIIGVFADGRILTWPVPDAQDAEVLPLTGPRWPLRRDADGNCSVTDRQAGLTYTYGWHPGYFRGPDGAGDQPLAAVTARNGDRITLSYTATGEPSSVTHSGGYQVAVLMSSGRVSGLVVADPVEPERGVPLIGYRYGDSGNVAEVVNSSGEPLRFGYDDTGRLTGWRDRNGQSYRYAYDEAGRCVAGEGPDGSLSGTFSYEPGITRWTDRTGATTTYEMDDAGRLATVTDPLGHASGTGYDEYGQVTSRTDAIGRVTTCAHDERGNLIGVTRPDGSVVHVGYDDRDQLIRMEEPGGTVWSTEWDGRGNQVRVTAPDGGLTSFSYDERGHLASVTDPRGAVTTVECDGAGSPLSVTSPGGSVIRYRRDMWGRPVLVTDPRGGEKRLEWTLEGRLAERVLPDGSRESFGYDGEGNLTEHVDQTGHVTKYEYGSFDAVTAVTRPDGSRVDFLHDQALRLAGVTIGGLTWTYAYDLAGRLTSETDFDGATTRYAHDPAGRLLAKVNAVGQRISLDYDALGRVARRSCDDVVTDFSYDAAGRLVSAVSPTADLRISRDSIGRVIAETCNGRTVASEYDAAGRRVRRDTPSGASSTWEYDSDGRPVALRTGTGALTFGYDASGREIRRELPGGVVLEQDWDPVGRLVAQTLTAGSRVLQRRGYTYRADGYLERLTDHLTGGRQFRLDELGRVTASRGQAWNETYSYDPVGNVASATWPTPPSGPDAGWLSGDVQGSRSRTGTRITRAGSVSYQYDACGRVISRLVRNRDTWRYEWDADDRLTSVTMPDGGTWRYTYDPFGRRIGKQQVNGGGQVTFTWDGLVLAEQAADAGVITWDYKPGTFTPVTQATGSDRYAIVTDLSGTPAELVSADGRLAGYQQHTLWGGTIWRGAATPLRFPGQYADPETGLHYNNQRYYDPVTGSYLTPDPLGLAPAPNPHAYVPNPHAMTDPVGLSPYKAQEGASDSPQPSAARRVLFGQRRVSPEFSDEGAFKGRSIYAVAQDLRSGVLNRDGMVIHAFEHNGVLVSENTRSLTALSLAGYWPTNIVMLNEVPADVLDRLTEEPLVGGSLPSSMVAVTPSMRDLRVGDIIKIPDEGW
jgi:RHS repeat-associated protein